MHEFYSNFPVSLPFHCVSTHEVNICDLAENPLCTGAKSYGELKSVLTLEMDQVLSLSWSQLSVTLNPCIILLRDALILLPTYLLTYEKGGKSACDSRKDTA